MAARARADVAKGHALPRVAPPVPLKNGSIEYREFAEKIGFTLYPWQETAAKYLTAVGPNDRWLYREVAIIVARQNGKTTLLIPLVMQRLLAGQSIMHTAQNAKLPREVHEAVATLLQEHYPERLPKKRAISYAVGHEEIRVLGIDGGRPGKYRIVAPTKGGARGPSNDTVLVDELREMEDHGFIGAAKPTLTVSKKPQMIYLSNAGTDESEVLNAIKARASEDPVLAYLEWSASPERTADDLIGWAEANPTLGHDPTLLETLQTEHRSHSLAGTLAIFETEHLCRWVPTLRELLVSDSDWMGCRGPVGKPTRPAIGVSLDPDAKRASVVMAWRSGDVISLTAVAELANVDVDQLREDVATLSRRHAADVGYDPITDADLVRGLAKGKAKSLNGAKFAAASARFAQLVAFEGLRWAGADAVTDDLTWTARKPDGEQGSYHAVRAKDDRSITASLAAIRAVWLASGPKPVTPKVVT